MRERTHGCVRSSDRHVYRGYGGVHRRLPEGPKKGTEGYTTGAEGPKKGAEGMRRARAHLLHRCLSSCQLDGRLSLRCYCSCCSRCGRCPEHICLGRCLGRVSGGPISGAARRRQRSRWRSRRQRLIWLSCSCPCGLWSLNRRSRRHAITGHAAWHLPLGSLCDPPSLVALRHRAGLGPLLHAHEATAESHQHHQTHRIASSGIASHHISGITSDRSITHRIASHHQASHAIIT